MGNVKGSLVADEGANKIYVKIARKAGWKVKIIPPSARGISFPDPAIVTQYTKGIHPIFTSDQLAYTLTKKELKNSGYIVHKTPRREKAEQYKEQIRRFFKKYTEKHTHRTKWTIEFEGEATAVKI